MYNWCRTLICENIFDGRLWFIWLPSISLLYNFPIAKKSCKNQIFYTVIIREKRRKVVLQNAKC